MFRLDHLFRIFVWIMRIKYRLESAINLCSVDNSNMNYLHLRSILVHLWCLIGFVLNKLQFFCVVFCCLSFCSCYLGHLYRLFFFSLRRLITNFDIFKPDYSMFQFHVNMALIHYFLHWVEELWVHDKYF